MKEKGQSLLEALIALGAASVIISAIAVAVITSVHNSDFSKYLNQATQYSQQGVAVVKQQSFSWNSLPFSGYQSDLTYCFPDGDTLIAPTGVNCDPNIGTGNFFIRTATISRNNAQYCPGATNGTLISVVTSWTDGKCSSSSYCHKATINTCVTDNYSVLQL